MSGVLGELEIKNKPEKDPRIWGSRARSFQHVLTLLFCWYVHSSMRFRILSMHF